MKNYYAILEVPVGSDISEVRESYRRLVQENLWNKEVFAELKEAYEVLSTPARRREYDQANFGQTFAGDDAAPEGTGTPDRRCPLAAGSHCPVINARAPLTEAFCPECGVLLSTMPAEGIAPVAAETDITRLPRFEEPGGDRVHRLRPGISIVGREAADVLLTDKTVSRRHAQVELMEDGSAFLEDLGSTNGTRIGEQVLSPHDRRPLKDSDAVRFGSVSLVLCLPMVETSAPPAPSEVSDAMKGEEDNLSPLEAEISAEVEGPAPLARLIGDRHGAIVREDALVPGVTTFGRRTENTVVLRDDPYISGMHAQIIAEEGTFRLTDLGSTNGTYLNGERLAPNEPVTLKSEDRVGIGEDVPLTEEL
jgi:pSer/pThr/pTyr-binding forkhead associated (FHA) protein